MQQLAIIVASVLLVVPFVACIQRRQTALDMVPQRECFDLTFRSACEESTQAQDSANIALECGADYLPVAENFAAQCIRGGESNDFCLQYFLDVNLVEGGALCAQVNDSDSCTTECSNFLQATVTLMGCCFRLNFNERLSQLLLGRDVSIILDACGIIAEDACDPGDFNLEVLPDAELCDSDEFWARISNYVCSTNINQATIDAWLQNPACLPFARNSANACSRGTDNMFCLVLYGTSLNPTNPTRTIRLHPGLSNAFSQCSNYSTFQSDGCPSGCRDALQAVITEIGCCINNFNDTVNEVLVPQFSADVMISCGIKSPGRCEHDFRLTPSSASVMMITAWVYMLCLSLTFLN